MFSLLCVILLAALCAASPVIDEYTVDGNYRIVDDIAQSFPLSRYFPENTLHRFGALETYRTHDNVTLPVEYTKTDIIKLQKCDAKGRGLGDIAMCFRKLIDSDRNNMLDERELAHAKERGLNSAERFVGWMINETPRHVIDKCTRVYSQEHNHFAHHNEISMVGILEAQLHCKSAPLPQPWFSTKIVQECDANGDGELTVMDDYVHAAHPCKDFPFAWISSLPDTCLCRCESVRIIFEICDNLSQ